MSSIRTNKIAMGGKEPAAVCPPCIGGRWSSAQPGRCLNQLFLNTGGHVARINARGYESPALSDLGQSLN